MTLRLNGSTSGYTEIDAPAVAGNNNLKLPGGNGSDGNILGTDGAGNLSWVNGRMVLATSQASTSGTFVDFTGIPSWVKRVTVMFNGVSTNGGSNKLIQIGDSSGVSATGYVSSSSALTTTAAVTTSTAGYILFSGIAAEELSGIVTISLVAGTTYICAGVLSAVVGSTVTWTMAGRKSLTTALDRIRITTVNGTDTFDAGSINILYEG